MDSLSISRRFANQLEVLNRKSLKSVDTSIIVFDTLGRPLVFHQYVALMYKGYFNIMQINGRREIKPLSMTSRRHVVNDSLSVNNSIYYGLLKADKIIVAKGKRRMYFVRNNKTIYQCPINLGKNPVGPKIAEGDGRTPEGTYNLDYQINTNAAYYRGYHISYPNIHDRHMAEIKKVKPGGDIMIHGTSESRSKLKDWTNGCIAISNSAMDSLVKYVYPNIPIEIGK